MKDLLHKIAERSSVDSQELDKTFASRVLRDSGTKVSPESDLRARYAKQADTWSRLREAGMIPDESAAPSDDVRRDKKPKTLNVAVEQPVLPESLNETQLRFLQSYLDDTEKKLQPYVDWLAHVELFRTIINTRFRRKSIRIDPEHGFVVAGNDGKALPLAALSSGEQHEIVVSHALIFLSTPGSLVLIDEPEISLHVEWQRVFVSELLEINRLTGCYFVVATHSPQIIDRFSDRLIGLSPSANDSD